MNDFLNIKFFQVGSFVFRASNLVGLLAILLVTLLLLFIIRRLIEGKNNRPDSSELRRKHSIFLLVKYVVWVVSIVSMMETIGLKVQLLLAGSAALLVGIGLGLQSIFSDFISGIFLLMEGTVKVGEIIEVDDLVGRVEEINLRNSKILSRENVVVIVPNSKFVTEKVVNWSLNDDSIRFSVDIGVAYGSDAIQVKEILESTMKGMMAIEKAPAPFVRFQNFGESSLDFELIFWTKQSFTVDNLKSELRFEIYRKLNENSIQIPFPQRDVHIKST